MKQLSGRDACLELWHELSHRSDLRSETEAIALLECFVSLLVKAPPQRRLMSRSQQNPEALWIHVFDSLQALRAIPGPAGSRILDAGSGSGLPGLPIAIALPASTIVLVDRSSSKSEFLEFSTESIGIQNTRVIAADLDAALLVREQPDVILMRALTPPESLRRFFSTARPSAPLVVFATAGNAGRWRAEADRIGLSVGLAHEYKLPRTGADRVLLELVGSSHSTARADSQSR